jgi:hypothetical protein
MQIDRVHADKAFAFLGFALSFLFLLAVVAFAVHGRQRYESFPSFFCRGN